MIPQQTRIFAMSSLRHRGQQQPVCPETRARASRPFTEAAWSVPIVAKQGLTRRPLPYGSIRLRHGRLPCYSAAVEASRSQRAQRHGRAPRIADGGEGGGSSRAAGADFCADHLGHGSRIGAQVRSMVDGMRHGGRGSAIPQICCRPFGGGERTRAGGRQPPFRPDAAQLDAVLSARLAGDRLAVKPRWRS